MDIKKMKMAYLKWCMENDKNPSEETMHEFFKTLGENSKVSFDGIIKNLDMKTDTKVDAIIGFVLEDDDDDSTNIRMFAAGHSNKGALVKATLNQINAMFFNGQFELNFNVGNDDANKIISMMEALLLVLTRANKQEDDDEVETDGEQKYMN